MIMKKRKMDLFIVAFFVLATFLNGCGNTSDDKNGGGSANVGEGQRYKVQHHDFTLEKDVYIGNVSIYDDEIYFVTDKYIVETGERVSKLRKMRLTDFSVIEMDFTALEEKHDIMDMFVDDTGIYFVSQYIKWDDEYRKLLDTKSEIVKCDFEGNVIQTVDITEDIADKGEEGYPLYLSSLVCDKDSNIVLTDDQSFIMAFDANGNKITEFELKGYGHGLIVAEDGKVYCFYRDEQNKEQIAPVDLKSGKLAEKLGDLNSMNASNFYIDENQVLWMSDETTLSTYDFESKEKNEVLNWIDYNVNGNDIRLIKKMSDGKIVAYAESQEQGQMEYIVVVLEQTDEPINEKIILTYATFGTDVDVLDAIIRFNKNSEEYRIEVVDYYNEDDYKAGMNAYNEAILNGEMADIINVDLAQYKSFARAGLYVDLNEFMDNDEDINRTNYFENVLDAYEVGGKLYAMPMSFSLSTLVGKTAMWGEEPGVTLDELVQVMNSLPSDVTLMDYMTKKAWLSLTLHGTIDNFVNWGTGECSFDSEEFINILEMANKFPEKFDYESQTMGTAEKIQAGKVLLYGDQWDAITDYQAQKALFIEDITAIGYPGVAGNGALIDNTGCLVAISSQSPYQEGAWEFVKYLISEEYQCNYVRNYNPIHKAAFDKQMESAMKVEYYTDENGEQVESHKMNYGWNTLQFYIYAATKEEVAEYKEILAGASVISSYDETIMSIINEEVEPFFSGHKTASDVANIIQGRVYTYVNENR